MEFSFNRFGLLVRKQWAEQGRIYLMGLAVLAGLIFLIGLLRVVTNGLWPVAVQGEFFMLFLWLSGGLFASLQFSALADKARGSAYLTLPASHLEKFAVGVFYAFVVFLPAFILTFYAIDVPLVELARGMEPSRSGRRPAELINLFTHEYHELPPFLLFFVLQAFLLMTSIYAGRYAFVKGGLLVILLFFGGLLLNIFLVRLFIDAPLASGFPFLEIYFKHSPNEWQADSILTPQPLRTLLTYAGSVALPLALLGIGYLRLTEKEI